MTKNYIDFGKDKEFKFNRNRFLEIGNDKMFISLGFLLGLSIYNKKHKCWIIKL